MKIILSFLLSTLLIFPQKVDLQQDIESLNLSSKNYLLYSVDTKQVLAEKNSQKKLSAASINKVLTTITALELLTDEDLEIIIEVDPAILETVSPIASTAELIPYQKLSLKEVLYGIMLPSGADATSLMSHYLTGTTNGLVEKMNEKAQEIGMGHTQIANTSGLDHKNQYTTLEDLLKLITYALENETFKEIYSKKEHTFVYRPEKTMKNQILKQADKIGFTYLYGAKSGFTTNANYALSSIARNEESEYIFISTQADGIPYINNEAFNDAIKIYDYLFDTYHTQTLIEKETLKTEIEIKNRFSPYELYYEENIESIVSDKFHEENIKHTFIYEDDLKAPIEENTLLGVHQIHYNDALIYQEDLYNQEAITRGFLYQSLYLSQFIVGGLVGVIVLMFIIGRFRLYLFRRKRGQL